jgi:SAM-dependent methyltransferase
MLAVLRERAAAEHLQIEIIQAAAEATGLPPSSFDVALAGEAYHWFDAPDALAEMARIVRPGGGIAFFWNVGDAEPSPLVAGERRLVAEYGIDGSDVRKPGPLPETRDAVRAAGAFEEPEFHQVRHVVPMRGSDYLGLAYTKSHLRTAPAELQGRYRGSFIDMMASNGVDLDDRIVVPYVVDCWIARRSAA